jgi:hypothetical protein
MNFLPPCSVLSPIAARAVGGGDGAAGSDTEHGGKQCGWNLFGQLIERCQASALRFDSEFAESVSQCVGADMSSGAAAGCRLP